MQKHRKGREGSEWGSSPLLTARPFPGNSVCTPLFIFETKMSLLPLLYGSKCGWRELLQLTQTAMSIVIVTVVLKQEGIGQDTILKKKNDIAQGHSIDWLEPTRPKMVQCLTSSGPWASSYALIISSVTHSQAPSQFQMCVCLVVWSWPTCCDSVDCSPPGSSAHGVLQARTLE